MTDRLLYTTKADHRGCRFFRTLESGSSSGFFSFSGFSVGNACLCDRAVTRISTMTRFSILTLFVLAVGGTPATAGVWISPNESLGQGTPSIDLVAELMETGDDEVRVFLGEFDGDSCDWSVSNAHGGSVFPIALPASFMFRGQLQCLGRVATMNRSLPHSPTLDGLLKPA